MTPETLRADLERVWAADTAVDPERWSPERPSTGHCAVTAMLVAEYTDATRIMRVALADGQSHYFNALPDGTEVDITRDQFDVYEPAGEAEERTIGYLVANPRRSCTSEAGPRGLACAPCLRWISES